MDTSAPMKDSAQSPAVTTSKASNRISALAAQVFGPSVDGKQVSHVHLSSLKNYRNKVRVSTEFEK